MKNSMFFPKGNESVDGIISKEKPVKYRENKKIILKRGIEKEEYNEIYEFLRDQNKMSSGNFTLLPKDELNKYIKFDSLIVLMRSGNTSSSASSLPSLE